MGLKQSYQEVSKVILEELVLNPVDFKKTNPQIYFYDLKLKHPEDYGGLIFDINGHEPYSKDLNSIFMDFKICGFMDFDNNMVMKSLEDIRKYVSSDRERRV
ncbi:MAG: hypothetical protein AABY32_03775 [Nanoarchaeota archaeon]